MRLLQLIARCALAAAFVPRPLPSHTAALTRRSGAITMPTNVDADGNVVDGPGDVEEDRLRPRPRKPGSMAPRETADAHLYCLSMDYEGLEDSYGFLTPSIRAGGTTVESFRELLTGMRFEGLLGCAEWRVVDSEGRGPDVEVVSVRVLPKPVPGCVKTVRVANQGGVAWPAMYSWRLERVDGVWYVAEITPERPPIDVDGKLRLPA